MSERQREAERLVETQRALKMAKRFLDSKPSPGPLYEDVDELLTIFASALVRLAAADSEKGEEA